MSSQRFIRNVVYTATYRDSVELMRISGGLESIAGVKRAAIMIATDGNKELLLAADVLDASNVSIQKSTPADLILCLVAESQSAASAALERANAALSNSSDSKKSNGAAAASKSFSNLKDAKSALPSAEVTLISVPGSYATAEALKALNLGSHVFMFSDNVSIEEEIEMKTKALEKGLMVMGPDCGTAVLDGIPLGFANLLQKNGPVGLVGASGTGLQEVSTLLTRLNVGVSQVIGVGGRDLDERVGGLMMLDGIRRLASDASTQVIVLVSKPPAESVTKKIFDAIAANKHKKFVVNFLGCDPAIITAGGAIPAATLEDAAILAARLVNTAAPLPLNNILSISSNSNTASIKRGKSVRGLYSGGTLCKEAQLLFKSICKQTGSSADVHSFIDLGDDEYTVGRPHPMIDFRLRSDKIVEAASESNTAIILLDVVLGYGSHDNPAAALSSSIAQAISQGVVVVASVTGTFSDPQNLESQRAALEKQGVIVCGTNAQAVRFAASLLLPLPIGQSWHASTLATAASPLSAAVASAPSSSSSTASPFFSSPSFGALSVGLSEFIKPLIAQGVPAIHLDAWRPPAGADRALGLSVARMLGDARIEAANTSALERIRAGVPMLVDIVTASEVINFNGEKLILHAGPPVEWKNMCGPMQGGVVAAILLEKWASNEHEAYELAASGRVRYAPCHQYSSVGPMAGIISPSMPCVVIENTAFGNRAYSTVSDRSIGKSLRFGGFDEGVISLWTWMSNVLAPALKRALKSSGPINVKNLIAQAIQMGDDAHTRNTACGHLFQTLLSPHIVKTAATSAEAAEVLEFLASANALFFLNITMASCKAMLDPARNIPYSTIVTAIARNGVEVGVNVSGVEGTWFTGEAAIPKGLWLPGFTAADANPDLGDSAITESYGIGACVMVTAPPVIRLVGGDMADAQRYTEEAYRFCIGRNPDISLPCLDFATAPMGVDIRQILDTGITPIINTGIAHKDAGRGKIGAGSARTPLSAYADAARALAVKMGL